MMKLVKRKIPWLRKEIFPLLFIVFLLLGSTGRMTAQEINHIYTDYLGFWSSGVGDLNPVRPDYSNNLVGFTFEGRTYSTGVNDGVLTQYGVDFIPMHYQALPVLSIDIASGESRFAKFGEMQDGLHNGMNPNGLFPYTFPIKLSDVLTDGIQGLDISTGVTNIKNADGSLIEMEYQFTTIESIDNIGDGLPDILVSQIAQPVSGNIDQMWFIDNNRQLVGNIISIDQTNLPSLGKSMNDFYDPNGNTANKIIYSERDIRISAYDAAEFGLTVQNYDQATGLIYKMGGTSDPAFIAFNTDLMEILVTNDDQVTTNINEAVVIDVMQNDNIPPAVVMGSLTTMEGPANGTATINPDNTITYTPNLDFTGMDYFKYEVCSSTGSCDFSLVSVLVGASDMKVTNMLNVQTPSPGDVVTFTVEVENLGPFEAISVNLLNKLPSGYQVQSFNATRGSYSALSGYWALGHMPVGEIASLTINAQIRISGAYTSTATVSSVSFDTDMSNNTASVTPEGFPSVTISSGCEPASYYQVVKAEFTGQAPYEVTYTWNGQSFTAISNTEFFTFDLSGPGVFQLTSMTDGLNRTLSYQSSPSTRVVVNLCRLITNPMLPSKAKQ